MSYFTDYYKNKVGRQTPNGYWTSGTGFSGQPMQDPEEVARELQDKQYDKYGQPIQQPQIDTTNAIGSLAELLGPTPAEREARERRLQENKSKMQAWAGLFDGLRQLGNLYYTAKGATPQQLSSPYQAIEQQVDQQRALADANDNYHRQYAQSLYGLRRQMSDDARKDILAQAQAEYYGTRDEVARQKAENDRLRAENARLKNEADINRINAQTDQINQLTPVKVQEGRSRIARNKQTGTAAMIRANKAGSGGNKRNKSNKTSATTSKTYENTRKLGL